MENMIPVTPSATPKTQSVQLKQPPKWLKRPCGANFGFGGKLVTFEATKEPNQPTKSVIKLGSVVTEESLLNRSVKLETSLQNGNLTEFCDDKLSSDDSSGEKKVWQYIKVCFFLYVFIPIILVCEILLDFLYTVDFL